MGKKNLKQHILFMNYQNRRFRRTSTQFFRSLEEVKKFLNKQT